MSITRMVIPGFRKWLRDLPQPYKLRCGDRTIRIDATPRKWLTAEETVVAINPAEVEALSSDGDVLRVFRIRQDLAEEKEPQKEAWPESDQAQLAVIITAACDRAASRHENAYKMAFDKLSQMFEAQTARLEETQQRNARLESELLRLKQPKEIYIQQDQDGPSAADAMLTTVLTGAVSKMITQGGEPVRSNGKG